MSNNQPLNFSQIFQIEKVNSIINKIQNFKNQTIITPNSNYRNSSFIILILCALCYFPISLAGQSCGGNITLRSQAEIDNFVANHGTCKTIGTLRLIGNDITNIDGLSNITTIGNFFAEQAPNLENFEGLSNLQSVNNAVISGCGKVTNLDGFSSLTRINQELRLSRMTNLTSIEGLSNVTRMPRFRIFLNPKLATCCLLYSFANNPNITVKVMYGNGGNCSVARILAHPNTSTISIAESDGTANDGTICKGTTAQLTASGAFDFTWNANASLTATDIANPMANPTTMTTYTVTASGCNNTVDNETFTVSVDEQGTMANAGEDQTKLNIGSFTLAGNTATTGTGSWSLVSGTANITNPLSPVSTVTGMSTPSRATLKWTITNGACSSSSEVELISRLDSDNDGIADAFDTCDDRIDSDGDSISDCKDDCDDRIDSDGDGISDCKDPCDDRIDSDGDGISDCIDFCDDRIDSDEDGTPDCTDNCPNDPSKIEPDACGCGTPPQIDSDGDGIVNCMDDCPYDLNQYVDGVIACGQTITGSTRLGQNILMTYGACDTETFNGRELFYQLMINTPTDLVIRFKEENLTAQPYKSTLFFLSDFCSPESCLGTIISRGETETLTLSALPAGTYFLAIDSRGTYDNAQFELSVDCVGGGSSALVACETNNILFEDFTGYQANEDITIMSPDWELFGQTTRTAYVQEAETDTTNRVLAFDRNVVASDVALLLDSNYYSGIYRVAWDMKVMANRTAYINVMGSRRRANGDIKYIIADEDAAIQDRWLTVEAYIDLDENRYVLFTDNRTKSFSGDFLTNLQQLNFYAAPNAHFYIDNICVSSVEAVPAATNRIINNSQEILTSEFAPMSIGKKQTTQQAETTYPPTFKMFPNPTTGTINYQGNVSTPTKLSITIYGQLGQAVRQFRFAPTDRIDLLLHLSDLPNGIYLMQVAGEAWVDTQRIVLQR